MLFPDTGLPWVLPSPNMPTCDTALVYPGQVLLEGTNLSEGRGTTRPFEIFGAPFIDIARVQDVIAEHGKEFAWKEPPYEYVTDRLPNDVLLGDPAVRVALENGSNLA